MTTKLSNIVFRITHLKVGCQAPLFRFKSECGKEMSLADLKGGKIILYFYPKDFTPGCTAQSCNLRDNFTILKEQGFTIIGINADDEKRHNKFISKYSLPFPLVPDVDLKIVKAYGVWGWKRILGIIPFKGIARTTFIIDAQGMIERIIEKINTGDHTEQILSPAIAKVDSK